MALLDRFKRKPKVVLPEEVNQYYQSQRRERVGVAIILGVVALVVTLLIAAGLFFGGRFVYRKIAGEEVKTPTQVQQTEEQKQEEEKRKAEEAKNNSNQDATPGSFESNPPSPAPAPTPTPTPPPTPPAPAPAPTSPSGNASPPLGDGALPRTGDEGL